MKSLNVALVILCLSVSLAEARREPLNPSLIGKTVEEVETEFGIPARTQTNGNKSILEYDKCGRRTFGFGWSTARKCKVFILTTEDGIIKTWNKREELR